MMENTHSNEYQSESKNGPEARYAYYRRCQEFRRNGGQCKAPAEKGTDICHAHTAQKALAARRNQERMLVLEEAAAQMRKRGRPEFKVAELFTDFNGIQVTIAVMAQALIDGRIDCKTTGRMAVDLQTMSKLLWMIHGRKGKTTPRINTDDTDLTVRPRVQKIDSAKNWAANRGQETRILKTDVLRFPRRDGWANGPPEWVKAA